MEALVLSAQSGTFTVGADATRTFTTLFALKIFLFPHFKYCSCTE